MHGTAPPLAQRCTARPSITQPCTAPPASVTQHRGTHALLVFTLANDRLTHLLESAQITTRGDIWRRPNNALQDRYKQTSALLSANIFIARNSSDQRLARVDNTADRLTMTHAAFRCWKRRSGQQLSMLWQWESACKQREGERDGKGNDSNNYLFARVVGSEETFFFSTSSPHHKEGKSTLSC